MPLSGEKPLTAHKKEENVMEKTIKVEGMMCQHCVAHVKKALEVLQPAVMLRSIWMQARQSFRAKRCRRMPF